MNIWRKATKVFALSFLFFVNFISINAQTIYELPAGTKIRVRMDNEVNSKVSSVNDTFTTVISEPVKVRDAVVVPIGAIISGRIVKVRVFRGGFSFWCRSDLSLSPPPQFVFAHVLRKNASPDFFRR